MVLCGLAKQLFVLIGLMALFAMLTVNVDKGTELSRDKEDIRYIGRKRDLLVTGEWR